MTSTEYDIVPAVDVDKPSHYINNAEFHAALTKYAEERKEALAAGKESPRIPEYVGECFLKIAAGLAQKHNFRNYSYIRDMIQNGVFTCVKNINSFDPARGTSAFAYFTQVVWYSFLGTIKKEKTEEQKKRDLFFKGDYDTFAMGGEDEEFTMSYTEFIKNLGTDTTPYVAPEPKKKKKKAGTLDNFVEGE